MYGYATEEEAASEAMQYLIYTNPNFPNMCQISYHLGAVEVVKRDIFIESQQPIRKERQLFYTRGFKGDSGCEQVSTGMVIIYETRRAHCSPHPELWAWDIKSSMCYTPVSKKPPAINSCPARDYQGLHGNPILSPTREKLEFANDIRGNSTSSLNLSRTYRSHRARDKNLWFDGYYLGSKNGPLGDGWLHNHEIHLASTQSFEDDKADFEQIRVQMSGGGFLYFTRVPKEGATYRSPSALHALTKNGSGWRLEDKESHTNYVFDKHGKVTEANRINGWRLLYAYGGNNLLTSVSNSFGQSLSFAYDSGGKLIRVDSSNQQSVQFAYTGSLLTGVQQTDGTRLAYIYDDANAPGLLSGVVDENGVRYSTFAYDADGWAVLTQKAGGVDRHSIPWYQQTTNGLSVEVIDPLNKSRTFSYQLFGNDLLFSYANRSPASSTVYPRYSASFDSNGLEKYVNDQKYNQKTTEWDANRRLPLTVTEAVGKIESRTTNTTWHPQWRLPLKITEPGRTTEYTYDERGNRLSQTVTDGTTARTTRWTYTPQSLVATETAPNGATTSYQYDSLGNLIQATNALGHTQRYTHDGAGRVLTHTDPNGTLTTYTYDLRGRMLSASVGGIASHYTYTPSGQLASAHFAHGHRISYQYDAAQRLVGWSDNRGASASYQLDPMGNRTSEEIRNAQGQQVWQLARSINSLNRVESTTQAGQTTRYGYDHNGDLTSTTNGAGETTYYGLDALRRLKTLYNAENATASLSYNAQDAITQARDYKGVSTTYGRDALGNATSETSPDSGQQRTQYDALGLPQQVTDALGRTTTYERDLLGRPTHITHADGASTTLQYDQGAVGYLSSITDPSGTTTYERDSLGRTTRKTQTLSNGNTRSIAYQYDASGQLSATTYPGGQTLQYQRDTTGQITALVWAGQPIVQNITWTPLGQPQSWQWTLPGAATSLPGSRSYNSAGQTTATETTSQQYGSAGRIQSLTQHLWHPADADSSHSTLAQSPATWSASYDRAGRLSALTKTSGSGHAKDTTTYQYDPNGNLTSSQRERAATTTTRSYRTESGHNKLLGFSQTSTSASGTASTSVTHTYDAAGNLQTDGLHQYHYDSQGRLQSSQTGQGPDAPTTRYAHNALGQRVFKTEPLFAAASSKDGALDDEEEDPGLLQTLVEFFTKLWNPAKSDAEHLGWAYVYDEDGSLLGEYGMGGAQSAGQSQYIYLPTAQGPIPMAAEIDNRLYAIHTDHLGTPRRLTQANGQAAWQWAYSAYGDEAPTLGAKRFTNETTNPSTGSTGIAPVRFNLRYPGQYFDEESGLHYNYFRSYDPRMGRYTQTDPIGLQGGWNRFAYVGGNPLKFVDPYGLRVTATYDHATGNLYVADDSTGAFYTLPAGSGGNPWGEPIPNGDYDILGHPDPDFYRLEPVDNVYGDDTHAKTGRDKFRLHKPGRTIGCIAADEKTSWIRARDMIRATTTDTAQVRSKSRNPFAPLQGLPHKSQTNFQP